MNRSHGGPPKAIATAMLGRGLLILFSTEEPAKKAAYTTGYTASSIRIIIDTGFIIVNAGITILIIINTGLIILIIIDTGLITAGNTITASNLITASKPISAGKAIIVGNSIIAGNLIIAANIPGGSGYTKTGNCRITSPYSKAGLVNSSIIGSIMGNALIIVSSILVRSPVFGSVDGTLSHSSSGVALGVRTNSCGVTLGVRINFSLIPSIHLALLKLLLILCLALIKLRLLSILCIQDRRGGGIRL